jgi:hypothetical protein
MWKRAVLKLALGGGLGLLLFVEKIPSADPCGGPYTATCDDCPKEDVSCSNCSSPSETYQILIWGTPCHTECSEAPIPPSTQCSGSCEVLGDPHSCTLTQLNYLMMCRDGSSKWFFRRRCCLFLT